MEIYVHYPLLQRNTFGINAVTDRFVEYDTAAELVEALADLRPEKHLFIGGGSNLLFTSDYAGIIFHGRISGIEITHDNGDRTLVRVGASTMWDDFVRWSIDHNLYGAECLSLIPGEVGAAAVQNIGAYGAEISQIVNSVETINVETLKPQTFSAREMRYAYRDSILKEGRTSHGHYAVTSVAMRLSHTFHPCLEYGALRREFGEKRGYSAADIREYVCAMRRAKLPDPTKLGNAGSFFKNPVVSTYKFRELQKAHPLIPHYAAPHGGAKIPAAWMIEQCGWRGKSLGRAACSATQPLVLVNTGGATAAEIMQLAACIEHDVETRFGIKLQREVEYVG